MSDRYIAWKGWEASAFGDFSPEQAIYFAEEFRSAGVVRFTGLRIGELGFGNGPLAGWARSVGAQWLGREAIPELRLRAVDAGYEVIDGSKTFADAYGPGEIDMIVAFDVLEHLDVGEIRAFLHEAEVALKSGGLLMFRVPSGDSPFSAAIYNGDLTHRTLLGSQAARQLAQEARFEVVQIRAPMLPATGLGLLKGARRAAVRFLQRLTFAFVGNVLMANPQAVVSANMIVLLRKQA